jgi:outer membrane protein OmpA-like peptidoglycan-associated protein
MVGNIDQYKDGAQTEIRFRPGQTVLSKAAKDALDQMAGSLKDQRSYIIEVRGFAPGHGSAAIASSRKMADSVLRYLVLNHQIPVYRVYVMSMGNAAAGGSGTMAKNSSGGRVEVNVMKNDLVGSVQH